MVSIVVQILSFALALASTVVGVILFLKSSAVRRYAAERDFGHLKNNYDNLARQWSDTDDRLGRIELQLTKIESLLLMRSQRDTD